MAHIKSLRGGAQAHLLRCDDGNLYAVKFRNNPQGQRILANEWLATAVSRYAGIETPDVTPIWIDEDFLRATPEVSLRLGTRTLPVSPGYHLGSCYVGNGEREPYDYLPDTLLATVSNRRDFLGALVVDKFLANADARQCVFVREHGSFHVHMIDFGYAFNGPNWDFPDSDLAGIYCCARVYDTLSTTADLEPWLSRVEDMPRSVITDALETLPPEWLAPEDHKLLPSLVRTAHSRQSSLRRTLTSLLSRRRATHFPAWQPTTAA